MRSLVVIYMPVYNEAAYIGAAIESVLAQSHRDFTLLISDNHSTDATAEIIARYARDDSRIMVVSPARHCPSLEHNQWLFNELLAVPGEYRYSLFMGGHDQLHHDYLRQLVAAAEDDPGSAIVYGRCDEIDGRGALLQSYQGYLQVVEQARYIIPIVVLATLTHNIVYSGLWRESLRQRVKVRYRCTGSDHLLIAEMALLGHIRLVPDALIFMRRMPGHGQGQVYKAKHLGDAAVDPNRDFAQQIDWTLALVDRAIEGHDFYAQPAARQMLRTATVSTYINRYWHNLTHFEAGIDRFFQHPSVQQLLALHAHYDQVVVQYLGEHLANAAQATAGRQP